MDTGASQNIQPRSAHSLYSEMRRRGQGSAGLDDLILPPKEPVDQLERSSAPTEPPASPPPTIEAEVATQVESPPAKGNKPRENPSPQTIVTLDEQNPAVVGVGQSLAPALGQPLLAADPSAQAPAEPVAPETKSEAETSTSVTVEPAAEEATASAESTRLLTGPTEEPQLLLTGPSQPAPLLLTGPDEDSSPAEETSTPEVTPVDNDPKPSPAVSTPNPPRSAAAIYNDMRREGQGRASLEDIPLLPPKAEEIIEAPVPAPVEVADEAKTDVAPQSQSEPIKEAPPTVVSVGQSLYADPFADLQANTPESPTPPVIQLSEAAPVPVESETAATPAEPVTNTVAAPETPPAPVKAEPAPSRPAPLGPAHGPFSSDPRPLGTQNSAAETASAPAPKLPQASPPPPPANPERQHQPAAAAAQTTEPAPAATPNDPYSGLRPAEPIKTYEEQLVEDVQQTLRELDAYANLGGWNTHYNTYGPGTSNPWKERPQRVQATANQGPREYGPIYQRPTYNTPPPVSNHPWWSSYPTWSCCGACCPTMGLPIWYGGWGYG